MKNLGYVVNLVRMDLNEGTTNNFQKFLQYAILGYRELRFKVSRNVKVLYATPNDAMIVPMPQDFETYTKIGIQTNKGIFNLSLNPDLPFSRKTECGADIDAVVATCECSEEQAASYNYGFYYTPHWRNGQYVGEMYGRAGGYNQLGYYRLDYDYRQIQFSGVPKTELYIEYMSSGDDINDSTLIPTSAVQAVRSYVHWQLKEFDSKSSLGERQLKKAQYLSDKSDFGIMENFDGISAFMDAVYTGFKPNKLSGVG